MYRVCRMTTLAVGTIISLVRMTDCTIRFRNRVPPDKFSRLPDNIFRCPDFVLRCPDNYTHCPDNFLNEVTLKTIY
jgi:hypothetical protein